MKKVMVTIVGDQPAPNLFLINDEAFKRMDQYIFITTDLMEERRKYEYIKNALSLDLKKMRKVLVPHDLIGMRSKLEELNLEQRNTRYFVNISSGSKIMSIGVFAFFSQTDFDSKIYYLSVSEKGYWQIHPRNEYSVYPFNTSVTLASYLISYGVKLGSKTLTNSLSVSIELTKEILGYYLNNNKKFTKQELNFGGFTHEIRKLYNNSRGKAIDVNSLKNLDSFLEEIGLDIDDRELSVEQVIYLIGGWFEEWVFYEMKEHLSLGVEAMGMQVSIMGLEINEKTASNEFDIIFLHQNTLYVVECKTGLSNNDKIVKERLDDSLYKLAALRRLFGINVKMVLLTLSDRLRSSATAMYKDRYLKRANSLNVLILDRYELLQPAEVWVKKIIGD